jgi:hypothetical protein
MMAFSAACGGDDPAPLKPLPDGGIVLPPDANIGPDAGQNTARCDTANQTGCADPGMPKCTVALTGNNMWSNTCRAQTGTVAEGAKCARALEGAPGVGNDDCAKGAYCTALGNVDGSIGPGNRFCRKFCRSSGSCGGAFSCVSLSDLNPPDGICIDTCTLWGTDCDVAKAWCSPARDINGEATGWCIARGTKKVGESCGGDIACDANAICIVTQDMPNDGICRAMCDIPAGGGTPAHPCGPMETCGGVNGLPATIGICAPMM